MQKQVAIRSGSWWFLHGITLMTCLVVLGLRTHRSVNVEPRVSDTLCIERSLLHAARALQRFFVVMDSEVIPPHLCWRFRSQRFK